MESCAPKFHFQFLTNASMLSENSQPNFDFNSLLEFSFAERDFLASMLQEDNLLNEFESNLQGPNSVNLMVSSGNIGTNNVLSIEDLYRPLSNATTLFPHLNKQPYDSSIFEYSQQIKERSGLIFPRNTETSSNLNHVMSPSLSVTSPITKQPKDKSHKTSQEARAQQQREASKRYRKKKKALVQELEHKVKDLMDEKYKIEIEKKEIQEKITKIKQENNSLRHNLYEDSAVIEKERMKSLAALDELVRKGASDEELLRALVKLKECCKRISLVGEWQGQLLINPGVVSQLVKSGFLEKTFTTDETSDAVRDFASKVFSIIPNLTPTQVSDINKIVDDYNEYILPIKSERQELNKELNEYFNSSQISFSCEKRTDITKILKVMSTLEYLRKNLSEEIQKADETFATILWLLNPRQHAKFYLEAEYEYKSVQQLKLLWEAMKHKTKMNVD